MDKMSLSLCQKNPLKFIPNTTILVTPSSAAVLVPPTSERVVERINR
ncbi:MAG: hypothetical protein HC912_12215 [Saprospiraceae bacterium]|nr:hypothetical protein [Saprospiraceae bacterium]